MTMNQPEAARRIDDVDAVYRKREMNPTETACVPGSGRDRLSSGAGDCAEVLRDGGTGDDRIDVPTGLY